jgi:hypothetical protein
MALFLLAWLTGCAGSGPGGTPPATCTPTVPRDSISYKNNIQPVFTTSCALGGCHDATSSAQGLNLSAGASYRQLVNVPSTEQRTVKRVQPGDPTASYLVRKIKNTEGITGTIMPQGCLNGGTGTNGAPCLTGDQMDMISTWILACAPNN